MALNNNKELYIKRTKQAFLYSGLLFLTVFNIVKFCEFSSSNPSLLTEYETPTDKFKQFRNPLIASTYTDKSGNTKVLILPENAINNPHIKIEKISGANIKTISLIDSNPAYENFLKQIFANKDLSITYANLSADLFTKENNLIVTFDNLENPSKKTDFIKKEAKLQNLRPQTFDILNIGSIYKLFKLPKKNTNLSLDEQKENLTAFITDYATELENFKNLKNVDIPLNNHFNDKASCVVLACQQDMGICEEFGTFNFEKSLKNSLINNFKQANKKYPNFEKKIFLLTKLEKQNFKTEQEFFNSLNDSTGVFIQTGLRQAVMLPVFWKKYLNKQEFINDLKIKSGINPDYWNEDINIYYFKAVEV